METIANIKGYLGSKCKLITRTNKVSKYRFVLILESGQGPCIEGIMAVACEAWGTNGEYWPAMLKMGTWVSVSGKLCQMTADIEHRNTGLAYMEAEKVAFI